MLLALMLAAPFVHANPQPASALPAQVYRDRRERVMREIDGCATAISAQGRTGIGAVADFRQDDDFFWLTGMNEPDAWLILQPKSKTLRTLLYLRPRDPESERWTGPRDAISPALKAKLGVDEVRRGDGGPRLLSAAPLHDCLAIIAPAKDLKDELETAFFENGATGISYGTIVGSGLDGAVLHWVDNSRMLQSGDLVVIDAAAEYGRYAADVTRTYPVSGKFTEEQAKVYRAVYQAQEDIFAAIKPGVTMADLQRVAEASLARAGYLDKFIHGFGHFVGLDVHDVGPRELPLVPGAVITVEPGIYLPERNFGVRIEDEVEILPDGHFRLLTAAFPRKLEDVEARVARARR
jgi:Xaa-Pro aminopeptidase